MFHLRHDGFAALHCNNRAPTDSTRTSTPEMSDTRHDRPPILRVLVLLVALVASALALAALSPPAPDAGAPGATPADAKAATVAAERVTKSPR